jgi:hypothetical protein
MARRRRSPSSVAAILMMVGALAGCAGTPTGQLPPVCHIDEAELLGKIDSRDLAGQLGEGLCPLGDVSGQGDGKPTLLIVSDPVDIQSYLPGPFGRAFGDVFRAAIFQRCQVPIRQVELGRDFNLTPQGITALTRDLREVRGTSFQAREAIITTYSLNRGRITLVARRLALGDSAITGMSTREVSWQCEQNLMGTNSVRSVIR